MTSAYLTQRQRTPPPMDRWSARLGPSSGGVDVASPRTLAPGLETELARYPGTTNDALIIRDRGPWFSHPRYIPPPVTWISWTEAGPTRPELHMRNVSLRTMVGNTMSRFPVVLSSPTTGMHTMVPHGPTRTVQRFVRTPQMLPGRYDRLAPGQYSGQTYSQTTRIQGR